MLSVTLRRKHKRSRDAMPVTKQYHLEEKNEIEKDYIKNYVYYLTKGERVKKQNCSLPFLVDNEKKNYCIEMLVEKDKEESEANVSHSSKGNYYLKKTKRYVMKRRNRYYFKMLTFVKKTVRVKKLENLYEMQRKVTKSI